MADARDVNGTCDVAVVGGGPAGLAAALLIARTGAKTAVVAPPPPADSRTTALLEGSVAILREAGVWEALAGAAEPLRKLRIADGGRRLLRAPEVLFDAGELGIEAFGWNVANAALTQALTAALAREASAFFVADTVARSRPAEDAVDLELADGRTLSARLAVAADGRNSLTRRGAGLSLKTTAYRQTALAFTVAHDRDHEGVSTELHCEEGPFTLVPMPGRRSSVVWATTPAGAEDLRALSLEALGEAATRRSGRLLGALRVEGRVGAFPVVVGAAPRLAARRTILVGEAAHVLPPIGAQGLNLGVRDAAAAAKMVAGALAAGNDPGGDGALRAYARARAADIWTRTAATDLLNRSVTTGFLPAHALRGAGLAALAALGPLRRFVMREGLVGGRAV